MKKLFDAVVAAVVLMAAPAMAAHYVLCTGIDQYKTSYIPAGEHLDGCAADARNVYSNALARGAWGDDGHATLLVDGQATQGNVASVLKAYAKSAKRGDVVLFYQSSYAYRQWGQETGLCMYDGDMGASEFAKMLKRFSADVTFVVVLDTDHSAAGTRRVLSLLGRTLDGNAAAFAAEVGGTLSSYQFGDILGAIVRGKHLTAADCGWVTSTGVGGAGALTGNFIRGCTGGGCDVAPYGNGDGKATVHEMAKYAIDGAQALAQCENTAVLDAVVFGTVGGPAGEGPVAAVPAAPANVRVTAANPSSITVAWDAVAGATGYRLDVLTMADGGTGFAGFAAGYENCAVPGTSMKVTGLAAGTTYGVRVRAVNEAGTGADSAMLLASTARNGRPEWAAIPAQGCVTKSQVLVDVASYLTAAAEATITLKSTTAEAGSFAFENGVLSFMPQASADYTFVFEAANEAGAESATVVVMATDALGTVPVLALSDATDEGFAASWTACADVDGVAPTYVLQVSTDAEFRAPSAAAVATVFSNAASSLAAPEGWTYGVTSVQNGGLVFDTAGCFVQTPAFDASRLAGLSLSLRMRKHGGASNAQTNLAISASTDGGQSWTVVAGDGSTVGAEALKTFDLSALCGQTNVILKFSDPGAGNRRGVVIKDIVLTADAMADEGSVVFETSLAGTGFAVTGLVAETTYYVRVAAGDGWSEVQSITTAPAVVPEAPVFGEIADVVCLVGDWVELEVEASGTPAPQVSLVSCTAPVAEYEAEDGLVYFEPLSAGTFAFTFEATNVAGTAMLTVYVTANEPVVPELTLFGATEDGFTASWSDCAPGSDYRLQVAVAASHSSLAAAEPMGAGAVVVDRTLEGTSLALTDLEPETTYFVRVHSADGWSAVQSITTLALRSPYEKWLNRQGLELADYPEEDIAANGEMSNWESYIADLNPSVETNVLEVVPSMSVSNDDPEKIVLSFPARPDRYYEVLEYSDLRGEPTTTYLGRGVEGMAFTNSVTETRFYKIRVFLNEPKEAGE